MQSQGELAGRLLKIQNIVFTSSSIFLLHKLTIDLYHFNIILQIMNKDTEDVEGELCDGVEQVLYSIVL